MTPAEAGAGHRTLLHGTFLWTVYRCAACADGETVECCCEDGGIYNDRDGSLADGRGCET